MRKGDREERIQKEHKVERRKRREEGMTVYHRKLVSHSLTKLQRS